MAFFIISGLILIFAGSVAGFVAGIVYARCIRAGYKSPGTIRTAAFLFSFLTILTTIYLLILNNVIFAR